MTVDVDHARAQARAQLDHIIEQVAQLEAAQGDHEREEAEREIFENPLELLVRAARQGWQSPNNPEPFDPAEFQLLMCTGGPAVRVLGDLDQYGDPETASIEYQDWGTPWTLYTTVNPAEREALLKFCSQFFFGG